MRLAILTSMRRGFASRCLPVLCGTPGLEVARVFLQHNAMPRSWPFLKRKIRKAFRIGPLGVLNGIRLREWYRDKGAEDLADVCEMLGIDLVQTDYVNSGRTKDLLSECLPDLGLSLGNGYISSTILSIPRYGMINVHTELLPRFQGAYGVIWPIYEGIRETGFTVHQMDSHIDTGPILFRAQYGIEFRETLRQTVEVNLEKARRHVPEAVAYVCSNYEKLRADAEVQAIGKAYTTPSIWQFLRMLRNHRRLAFADKT
ncbi:MAG: formyltransferase family protein [Thermodesulfobacteriota bacterium]